MVLEMRHSAMGVHGNSSGADCAVFHGGVVRMSFFHQDPCAFPVCCLH